jgi:hypothetical protein
MAIQRTFQNIPEGKLSKSDHQFYLVNLGWSSGTGWHELLRSKRVLIVSEAGAGKTYECSAQRDRLKSEGQPAFYLELARLAACSDLRSLLDHEEETHLDEWLASQAEIATFFLDSIDELKLSLGSFEEALKRLGKGIAGQLGRARIVITTRPVPFDEQLIRRLLPLPEAHEFEANGESFARIAMGRRSDEQKVGEKDKAPDWRTVALMPFSDAQIEEFSRDQGVSDSTTLLADLKRRNAEEFARRPQDLIELCADWRRFKRIRTHNEQVASNIHIKLKPREDRREPAELSVAKAIEGASRLALAMMVTRRLTIRHSAEADVTGGDVALDPTIILADWSVGELKALLERPLFGFASYGRVRFHHRSVAEYLAAERIGILRKQGMSVRALNRLLFANVNGNTIVRPSKRPIAGWLALNETIVHETLRDHEPAVLLTEGDPESLTVPQRNQALRAYVERYGKGGWRGLSVPPIQIHRFASPELAGEINRMWAEGIENLEVREILLSLVKTGGIANCADIVHSVALDTEASAGERLIAIEGLAALADPRFDSITAGITANANQWPDNIARGIIVRLFPEHLSVSRLCEILRRVGEKKGLLGDLSWHLPDLINRAEWKTPELEELRDGLVKLASGGLRFQNEWSPLVSDRPHLGNALAAACLLGLKIGKPAGWLHACALALRLSRDPDGDEKVMSRLKKAVAGLPPEEIAILFWADDALMQSLSPHDNPWNRCSRLTIGGTVQIHNDRDWGWIGAALSDPKRAPEDRAMLLEIALRLSPSRDQWHDHVTALKPLIADLPDLVSKVDECLKPAPPDTERNEWEIKAEKRRREAEQKDAENRASWIQFWQEVAEQPDVVFSEEKIGNTAWNLWRAMHNAGGNNRASDWNRPLIEAHFGKAIADRLRLTLMDLWRKDRPTFESERPDDAKGTFLVRWQLGLAAIYAEAEDPQWAVKLSGQEAELATRYVSMEMNSLPSWIEPLTIAHPRAIDVTLGNELELNLNRPAQDQWHSMLLQNITHSTDTVVAAFLPRLRGWLDANFDRLCASEELKGETHRLSQVVDVLMKHGDHETQMSLLSYAKRGIGSDTSPNFVGVWLPVLMRLDAGAGVDALEELVQSIEVAERSKAVALFAALFGDRHEGIDLSNFQFTPAILLRLMRLAYCHVRPSDDAKHEGSFSPDERDDAETARNQIVNALLKASGEEGWAAKLEMADDPLCHHFKDRIIAMAEEQRAEEADAAIFDDVQAIALDRTGEAPPSSNEAMFALMVDRLDDLDELLLSDASPREAWAAISAERVMRREIVRALMNISNGLYKIDQESVTADEKETDVRMLSTASPHEAVIELKLADERTAADLRDTIENQLVTKYLAPETRRSGCLLMTLSKDRRWNHPDDGSSIGFPELVTLLRAEAERIEKKLGGNLRLHVHALDLRARLQTEPKRTKAGVAQNRG